MEWLTDLGSIASILGIPSIFALLVFLHKKHISILKAQIALLESEKEWMKETTPDRLIQRLESRLNAYEMLLEDKEQLIDSQEQDYTNKMQKLKAKISELHRDQEIFNLMEDVRMGKDYRYDILVEQQKNK